MAPRRTIVLHDLGGDGPPLLLLHATGYCALAYTPLAAVLRERARVLAVDLPAHGEAQAPAGDGPLSWHATARALSTSLDAAGEVPRLAVGHSFGAAVALALAARHPDRLDAIYAYEPPVVDRAAFGHPGMGGLPDAVRRRREEFPSRAAALAAYRDRDPFSRLDPAALEAYVAHGFAELPDGRVRLRCAPADESRTYEGNDIRPEDLVGVTAAVTIAHGRPGEFGGRLVPPVAAPAIPHARVIAHEDLSHFGPLEAPERIAREALAELGLAGGHSARRRVATS